MKTPTYEEKIAMFHAAQRLYATTKYVSEQDAAICMLTLLVQDIGNTIVANF